MGLAPSFFLLTTLVACSSGKETGEPTASGGAQNSAGAAAASPLGGISSGEIAGGGVPPQLGAATGAEPVGNARQTSTGSSAGAPTTGSGEASGAGGVTDLGGNSSSNAGVGVSGAAANQGGSAGTGESTAGGAGGNTGGGAGEGGNGAASAGGSGGAPMMEAAPTSLGEIFSGVPWLDTDGNLVNAHGVGFIQLEDTYYMVGEQRSGANDTYSGDPINTEDTFTGVSLYSTRDFVRWTFEGTVVTPVSGTVLDAPYYGERPKLLYNASINKFVMYIKMLNYTGNPPVYRGYFAVLTSDAITGPYEYQGNLTDPSGREYNDANDFQVYQDADGAQYMVRHPGTLYRFAEDGMSISSTVASGVPHGEAPSLHKDGNTYFWQSSDGTYWHANDNSYAVATSLGGPWTYRGNFCPKGSLTWQSQNTAVVSITGTSGTTQVYIGDRWVNGDLPASTLVIQPLTLNGNSESIPEYQPVWHLDVAAGTWEPVEPTGTSINDATSGDGVGEFAYSEGWMTRSCGDCFEGDQHVSSMPDATATVAFEGTQILLYSTYDNSSGILGVTLMNNDGTELNSELHVSLRQDAPAAGNYLVYASPVLPQGAYRLQVRVTGMKDPYSSGSAGNIDRVLIVP